VSAAILLAAEVEPDTGADADKADADDEGIKEVKERLASVEWRVEGRKCVKRESKANKHLRLKWYRNSPLHRVNRALHLTKNNTIHVRRSVAHPSRKGRHTA
jgi:hypothetical protein